MAIGLAFDLVDEHLPMRRELEQLAGRLHIARLQASTVQQAVAQHQETLTDQEQRVLRLVALGYTNAQIGKELFISPKTASVHVSNILSKLGVSNRGAAARWAHTIGMMPD